VSYDIMTQIYTNFYLYHNHNYKQFLSEYKIKLNRDVTGTFPKVWPLHDV